MDRVTRKRLTLWLPLAAALGVTLFVLLRPQPVAVDLASAERGALAVTVTDEGETRVKEVYTVSAPIAGLMRRIDLEAGDPVVAAETVVARIEPTDPVFLDVRTEAEAEAAARAAEAARDLAAAEVERAEAEVDFARAELTRFERLAERETVSPSQLDEARRRARTAVAAMAEARAQLAMRDFELEQARARLLEPSAARERRQSCDCVQVYSPVSGRVLRVLVESEGVVASGTALVEVGDPSELEVVVDLLSSDAVRVEPGQDVRVEGWGGAVPLRGVVQRVEPFGFTKVSALGIEEQRVNVIIDLTDPPQRWVRLGHGYRVEPQILLWQRADALKVPMSALFRDGEQWAVFVAAGGRAALRHVEVGQHNGLEAEILGGLEAGERVVEHPGERVSPDVRIVQRGS